MQLFGFRVQGSGFRVYRAHRFGVLDGGARLRQQLPELPAAPAIGEEWDQNGEESAESKSVRGEQRKCAGRGSRFRLSGCGASVLVISDKK